MTQTQNYSSTNLPPYIQSFIRAIKTGNPKKVSSLYKKAAFKGTANDKYIYGEEGASKYFPEFMKGKNELTPVIDTLYTTRGGSSCGEYSFNFIGDDGIPVSVTAAYTFKGELDGSITHHHSSFAEVSNHPKDLGLPVNAPEESVNLPQILKDWQTASGSNGNTIQKLYVENAPIKSVESPGFVCGISALAKNAPEISGASFQILDAVEKTKGLWTGSAALTYEDSQKSPEIVNFGIEVVKDDGMERIASQHLSFG